MHTTLPPIFADQHLPSIPLHILAPEYFSAWLVDQPQAVQHWLHHTGFQGKAGEVAILPSALGEVIQAIAIQDKTQEFWFFATLAHKLPPNVYALEEGFFNQSTQANQACLAWGLSHYQFKRYKQKESWQPKAQLCWPRQANQQWVMAGLQSHFAARNLINTPANDLGPQELATYAQEMASLHQATCQVISGEELLAENYPAVYTVGKASSRPPCLIDLKWSHAHPKKKIVLVGKGVCFDSGGLDLKPSSGMLIMKKDMGGAAHVLALAHWLMSLNLPLELRVLIPAVENSISGNAMRPLDVITTRQGLTVEIGNTDAEGRLILADALTEACATQPDLIIDFATLTGAARIALGTDLPGVFGNDETTIKALVVAAQEVQDPLWHLPLHRPYADHLKSTVADLSSTGKSSFGGAIIAALFLEKFTKTTIPWIHIDLMAWNLSSRPGRPEGGEAMGLRAVIAFIETFLNS